MRVRGQSLARSPDVAAYGLLGLSRATHPRDTYMYLFRQAAKLRIYSYSPSQH